MNSNSNINLLAMTLGTAVLCPLGYEYSDYSMPVSRKIPYKALNTSIVLNNDLDKEYTLTSEQEEHIMINEKIHTLKNFSENLIKKSESLDDEAIDIINDNFWNWI